MCPVLNTKYLKIKMNLNKLQKIKLIGNSDRFSAVIRPVYVRLRFFLCAKHFYKKHTTENGIHIFSSEPISKTG